MTNSQPEFVHSDFPEPVTKVKGIEVRYWESEYAMELMRKYFPTAYSKWMAPKFVDIEV